MFKKKCGLVRGQQELMCFDIQTQREGPGSVWSFCAAGNLVQGTLCRERLEASLLTGPGLAYGLFHVLSQ